MRVRTSLIAATAAALLGCRETPEALQATGGVALDVRVGGASGVLQAGRILVRGPTDTTVDATPGDIVTIGGLKVGAYTVSLEGLVGGKVAMFGETSVWVNAGQASQATVTLASFQPGAPVVDAVSFGNPQQFGDDGERQRQRVVVHQLKPPVMRRLSQQLIAHALDPRA